MSKQPAPGGDLQPLQDLNRSFAQAETAFAARLQASVQRIEQVQAELLQSQQAHERERGIAERQATRIGALEAALASATESAAAQAQEFQSQTAALQASIDELTRQGSQIESTHTQECDQWVETAREWRTREQALVQQVEGYESAHQRLSRDSVQRIEQLQAELLQCQQAHERERGTAESQASRIGALEAALTAASESAAAQAQDFQSRTVALQAGIEELARQGGQLESAHAQEREQWDETARDWRAREQTLVQQIQGHESDHQRMSRDLEAGALAIEALRSQGQATLGAAAQELQALREMLATQRREFDLDRQALQHRLELARGAGQTAQSALQSAQARQQGLERDLAALTAGHQALQQQWQAATQAAALARAAVESERGARQQDQTRAQQQVDALGAQCSQSDQALKALHERSNTEKAAHAKALSLATTRVGELGHNVCALEARLADQARQHGQERGLLRALTATAQDELRQALAQSQLQRDAQDAALQAERAQRAADLARQADDRGALKAELAEGRQRSDRAEQQRHRDLAAMQALALQRERQARALALALERLELQLSQRAEAPDTTRTPDTPDTPAAPNVAESPAPADLPPPPQEPPTGFDAAATAAPAQHLPTPISLSSELTPMDIQHVNQLLALRGAQFVRKTYSILLGREPDPQGEAYFTQRAATQHDKAAILYEFATSAEATGRTQTLAGLSDLIQLHHPRKGRLRRWLQRASQAMSASHRVEISLDQLGTQTDDRLQNIESRLGTLDARVESRLADMAQETAQARSQLIGLTQELNRCAYEIAALPQKLSSHLSDLLASQAATPVVAVAETPEVEAPRPSALALRLTAAHGAADFFEHLTRGLRASDEAQRLANHRGT